MFLPQQGRGLPNGPSPESRREKRSREERREREESKREKRKSPRLKLSVGEGMLGKVE